MAKNSSGNFTLKHCLFGATTIIKNCDKYKYVYSGYGIACDGLDSLISVNDVSRNVKIFGIDNSSSSHADNPKNKFLVLVEGATDDINDSIGAV